MSSVDRIGELSDDVICHILSFLPTKDSVSTSCLAKRWRFLWAHVPKLDFKRVDFEDQSFYDSDVIYRVMLLHQAKVMHTLSLSDCLNCSGYKLFTWIIHAVNRGVRNIYLESRDRSYSDSVTLPRCFLTCQTLVDVKLDCCMGIPSSGEVVLPSLKKLHLSRIKFEDEESLPHLLSGCPVLEDLTIEDCYKETLNDRSGRLPCVSVSSPTIKILTVDLSNGRPMLKIDTPSLRCLNVESYSLKDITSLSTMTSLIEADFYLLGDWNGVWTDNGYNKHVVQFLNCLCNLKCLKIRTDDHQKLVNILGPDSVVQFDNLTKLKFDSIYWHEIVKFLAVANNLEVLTFTLGGKLYTYMEPKLVPTCMLSRLKTVRIKASYVLNAQDFETIEYVLRNARVLERMEIHFRCISEKEKLEMLGRISFLERGSCTLFLYWE